MSNLNHGARRALAEKSRLGRTATIRTCKTCAQTTLVGLDDDACAFTVTVDPYPISQAQELSAAINGRRTYSYSPGKRRLDRRTPERIIGSPIKGRVIVLISHECWTHPIGDTDRDVLTARESVLPENPPY